jgi:hypothetical protein
MYVHIFVSFKVNVFILSRIQTKLTVASNFVTCFSSCSLLTMFILESSIIVKVSEELGEVTLKEGLCVPILVHLFPTNSTSSEVIFINEKLKPTVIQGQLQPPM